MLDDSTENPQEFSQTEKMRRCEEFYDNRQSRTADLPAENQKFGVSGNFDILLVDFSGRVDELHKIQTAIRTHRDISGRPRNLDDDRALYAVLPVKIPADFRLPNRDEFLGRAKNGAGCPNFWDSHSGCGKSCNLHKWGPCT